MREKRDLKFVVRISENLEPSRLARPACLARLSYGAVSCRSRHADDWIAGGPASFSTACYIEWISSIRLQAEPPGLKQDPVWCQQEQPEGLQARQVGLLVLMQQRIQLVWELRAAWEEQVSPA